MSGAERQRAARGAGEHEDIGVLRGGEKPLPPGLATRLFDPAYDESVEDVDGIGEFPPGQVWKPGKPVETTPPSAAAN